MIVLLNCEKWKGIGRLVVCRLCIIEFKVKEHWTYLRINHWKHLRAIDWGHYLNHVPPKVWCHPMEFLQIKKMRWNQYPAFRFWTDDGVWKWTHQCHQARQSVRFHWVHRRQCLPNSRMPSYSRRRWTFPVAAISLDSARSSRTDTYLHFPKDSDSLTATIRLDFAWSCALCPNATECYDSMTSLRQSVARVSVALAAQRAALMVVATISIPVSHRFASSFSYFVSGCERAGLVLSSFEWLSSAFVLATFDCNYPTEEEIMKSVNTLLNGQWEMGNKHWNVPASMHAQGTTVARGWCQTLELDTVNCRRTWRCTDETVSGRR